MKNTTTGVRRKLPTGIAVLISVLATALLLVGALFALLGRDGIALMQGWVLARWAFVEEDADLGRTADNALWGLVSGLGDRWSYYVDADRYASLVDQRANRYLGIGVTIGYDDERGLRIHSVTADGPADLAGVQEGDIIIAVNGVSLAGDARYEGADLIPGALGDQRVLSLLGEDGGTRELTVTLSYIPQPVVTGKLLGNGMGLVTIRNFNTNAFQELKQAVEELMDQGAHALIFDVRNDGGGYINELTQILDFLLPQGDVFRSDPRWGISSISRSDEACIDLPFGVLVNTESYSAAELFAAQLRETAGAPIVGEHTSGKGYSQITFRLINGGALGLSTARYSTGSGVSLIGTGITPDVELSLDEERAAKLSAGTLEPEDDPQLQALITLMEQ